MKTKHLLSASIVLLLFCLSTTAQTTFDTGIQNIVSPSSTIGQCNLSDSVIVNVKNHGTDTITQVTIYYEINGTVQPGFSYQGTLLPNKSAVISIGVSSFSNNDKLKVYTSMPNGSVDLSPSNDTLATTLHTAMQGSYTVGVLGDFSTVTDAVDALKLRGVCGNTTLVLDGNSTFNEQVVIPKIAGSSALNAIIFTSDPSTPMAEIAFATLASANYVVELDETEYVTFDGLKITSTGTAYTTAFLINSNSRFNTLQHCNINAPVTTNTSFNYATVKILGTNVEHNSIINNNVHGGSIGICFYTHAIFRAKDNLVARNTITDPRYLAIYLYYTETSMIKNNLMSSSSTFAKGVGILCYEGQAVNINGNVLKSPSGSIWPDASYALSRTKNSILANNHAHNSGANGIFLFESDNNEVHHNNVATSGNNALFVERGINNNFHNNNLLNYGTGYAINVVGSGLGDSDYNNLSTKGTSLVYYLTNYADLTAWSGAGFDQNSIDVDTVFTNYDSLWTCDVSLYKMGKTLSNVPTDINGNRRLSPPNIGAEAFIIDAIDFSLGPDQEFCTKQGISLGAPMPNATYLWSTKDTTASIFVTDPGTYSVTITNGCGVVLTDEIELKSINPVADFSMTQNGFIHTFSNASKNGTSYLWDFGDGSTSIDVSPWHVYASNGSYSVSLTVYSPCDTVTTTKIALVIVGVEEQDLLNDLTLFPNPANDHFSIRNKNNQLEKFNLTLSTVHGKVAIHYEQLLLQQNEQLDFDISALSPGIYLLRLSANNKQSTHKIVVQ
jgi:parallel beta-helix repeat protein